MTRAVRRAAGIAVVVVVTTTTAIAARHPASGAGDALTAVSATAWLPDGDTRVVLADGDQRRPVTAGALARARQVYRGTSLHVTQVGRSAVVTTAETAALVDGRTWQV